VGVDVNILKVEEPLRGIGIPSLAPDVPAPLPWEVVEGFQDSRMGLLFAEGESSLPGSREAEEEEEIDKDEEEAVSGQYMDMNRPSEEEAKHAMTTTVVDVHDCGAAIYCNQLDDDDDALVDQDDESCLVSVLGLHTTSEETIPSPSGFKALALESKARLESMSVSENQHDECAPRYENVDELTMSSTDC
jgi:hypothetical protein